MEQIASGCLSRYIAACMKVVPCSELQEMVLRRLQWTENVGNDVKEQEGTDHQYDDIDGCNEKKLDK